MEFFEGLIYMIWRGAAIGVIISAPMGPVGILCVQRTLQKGRRTGLHTGIGAAISDLFYCLLTGFGLSFVEDFLKANQDIIQIIGSVVLLVFGLYLFRSNPARSIKKPELESTDAKKDILSGFLFTFSNPLIIFLIIGLFARFNFLLPEITLFHYIIGFLSIFGGALLWWWVVTFFVNKVRTHFNLRSMWLINKITGSIIMIFAIVGMVTAISGLASAAEPSRSGPPVRSLKRTARYYNSSRGFDSQGAGRGAPMRLEAGARDSLTWFLPLDKAEEFSFSFRAASSKRTAWTLRLVCAGTPVDLTFAPVATDGEIYQSTSSVTLTSPGKAQKTYVFPAQEGWNSYELKLSDGKLHLGAGAQSYKSVFTETSDAFTACDSIGISLPPKGGLALDWLVLEEWRSPSGIESPTSHFASPDVRRSYFARTSDPIEGEWEEFDRALDDACLVPGGRYRIAIVKNGPGYDMIYLDGATKRSADWQPGRLKGTLTPRGSKDVFDVEWMSPAGRLLEGEIVGQYAEGSLLTFQFVRHNSTLRLHKIRQ